MPCNIYSQQIEQVDLWYAILTGRLWMEAQYGQFQIGGILTKGLGAGQDATTGRKSA